MPRTREGGWRGVGLIAITYVYFLIFAQFAFLKRLAALGIAQTHLKPVMAAMALGGVALSLLAPRLTVFSSPALRLRLAFMVCAAAALFSLQHLSVPAVKAVSCLIGCGLGLLAVTLVTHLPLWLGLRAPLLAVATGTGLGYFACNIPPFFAAPARTQTLTAAGLCLAGLLFTGHPAAAQNMQSLPRPAISFWRVLTAFTALVWLDSAAFFIIQNTAALKSGTWEGTLHLWVNACLHLGAALACAWLLRRRGLFAVLVIAYLALAAACLLLLDPHRALLASCFYPVGVSLYSVALVAYPSGLATGTRVSTAIDPSTAGRRAGWIYAIAGWCGSALGIGMGQNLGHVPPAFVLLAGVLIVLPGCSGLLLLRKREMALTAGVLLAAWGIEGALSATHAAGAPRPAVERGRQVYISEGCINCHSQYVRPHTADVLMWGPVQTVEELRQERPPLIGNRRQGPDLAEVGSRRSPLWLRAHFYHPSEVSHSSFMPAYEYLFADSRGDDLLAYMQSLQGGDIARHLAAEAAWRPSASGSIQQGAALFQEFCTTCHAGNGPTRRRWQSSFRTLPPDLFTGPYLHLRASHSVPFEAAQIAPIVKFGLYGTDMPGHEYLSDREIASISLCLATNLTSGERQ